MTALALRDDQDYWDERTRRDPSGCLLWTRATKNGGYGNAFAGGKFIGAHRLAYLSFVGPIPEGYEIDHLCRTPLCVEPTHLEAVTPAENRRRQGAAVTHCPQGHEYTPDNLVKTGSRKERQCRTCLRDRARARTAAGEGGRNS